MHLFILFPLLDPTFCFFLIHNIYSHNSLSSSKKIWWVVLFQSTDAVLAWRNTADNASLHNSSICNIFRHFPLRNSLTETKSSACITNTSSGRNFIIFQKRNITFGWQHLGNTTYQPVYTPRVQQLLYRYFICAPKSYIMSGIYASVFWTENKFPFQKRIPILISVFCKSSWNERLFSSW